MGRVFKSIILGVLIFAIGQSLALDSEYKNALNKIELVKTGESSYRVNLYTQKSYAQSPRIIKKSDYNYYILLPETKNSAPAAARNAQDISSVSANLYPYAGQDINNGYTKININTTKPIAFELNIKNSASKVVQTTQNKVAATSTTSTEKKTSSPSVSQNTQKINSPKLQPKQTVVAQNTKTQTVKPNNAVTNKQTKQSTQTTKTTTTTTPIKQITKTPSKQTAKTTVNTTTKAPVKKVEKPVVKTVNKIEPKPVKEEQDIQKPVSLPSETTTKAPVEEPNEPEIVDDTKATVSKGDIFVPLANNADIEDDEMFDDNYDEKNETKINKFYKNITSSILAKKNSIDEKLSSLGISLTDILWMILIGLISLYIVFKILTRKHPQAKLRNKSEFNDKKHNAAKQKKKGQYFIFDKNIKQTEFKDPQDPNKNYELAPYSPDNTLKFNKTQEADAKPNYNLYEANNLGDIIEKAQEIELGKDKIQIEKEKEAESKVIENFGLSEDALELYNQEQEEKAEEIAQTLVQKDIQKQGLQQRLEETQIVEPKIPKDEEIQNEIPGLKVLSKVEIAPERGFMCVSYNDNINLIGYIFDDVFALHNFKKSKLQNYDIRFRLSERDNKGAYFIVKIENTKLLIKVTRMSMALEVVM